MNIQQLLSSEPSWCVSVWFSLFRLFVVGGSAALRSARRKTTKEDFQRQFVHFLKEGFELNESDCNARTPQQWSCRGTQYLSARCYLLHVKWGDQQSKDKRSNRRTWGRRGWKWRYPFFLSFFLTFFLSLWCNKKYFWSGVDSGFFFFKMQLLIKFLLFLKQTEQQLTLKISFLQWQTSWNPPKFPHKFKFKAGH